MLSGNVLVWINVVALRQAQLVLGWVCALWVSKRSWYVGSHLGELSLPSLWGR